MLKISELEQALGHVKQLQGLLPICMHCQRIRNDKKDWERHESYIEEHAEVEFSQGLCDECVAKVRAGAAESA